MRQSNSFDIKIFLQGWLCKVECRKVFFSYPHLTALSLKIKGFFFFGVKGIIGSQVNPFTDLFTCLFYISFLSRFLHLILLSFPRLRAISSLGKRCHSPSFSEFEKTTMKEMAHWEIKDQSFKAERMPKAIKKPQRSGIEKNLTISL